MSVWVLIEAVACSALFFGRNRFGFMAYQTLLAGAYLVALTFDQTLDFTMSVYFFFAVVPFLGYFRFSNFVSVFAAIYLAGWVAISVLLNGAVSVLSALIIHYLGPLLLFFVFVNVPKEKMLPKSGVSSLDSSRYSAIVLILVCVIETVIGIIATSMSPTGRLMLNYQCVSGCLACSGLVLFFVYCEKRDKPVFVLVVGFILFAWAMASGTRGYMVLALAISAVVALKALGKKRLSLFLCLALAALCIYVLLEPDASSGSYLVERFSSSTGRRGVENSFSINLFILEGPIKELFGFGIGSTYSGQEFAAAAFSGISATEYEYSAIMAGDNLHNFWFTMLLSIGLIGFLLYVSVMVVGVRGIRNQVPAKIFKLVALFLITYAFVLWFRWTATSGIFESCLLAFLIKCYQIRDSEKEKDCMRFDSGIGIKSHG